MASVNYGEVPEDAESALRGACPVVGSFGARDVGGTKPAERLERALTVLEVPHDVQVYPGSGHRFMTESSGAGAVLARFARMSYQEADAADAWRRIYAFFGEHLGGDRRSETQDPGRDCMRCNCTPPSSREIAPEESTLDHSHACMGLHLGLTAERVLTRPAWDCMRPFARLPGGAGRIVVDPVGADAAFQKPDRLPRSCRSGPLMKTSLSFAVRVQRRNIRNHSFNAAEIRLI